MGLKLHPGGSDFDGLLGLTETELGLDSHGRVAGQSQAGLSVQSKSLGLYRHIIFAGGQVGNGQFAGGVGLALEPLVGGFFGDADLGIRDARARAIGNDDMDRR